MDESLAQWFAQEILVHEEALVRFLTRTWPYPSDIHDLRQDTYVRIYEAAAKARPAQPRAFMYATARNLMTDRVRRGRVVSIEVVGDMEALNVSMDAPEPDDNAATWHELKRLANALDRLPDRCRAVVWLHKMEELTYPEVAARLGISIKTVEKQVSKGIKRLAQFYLQNQPLGEPPERAGRRTVEEESHG
ncbi:RNA polymerase sigma factor [Luteimonas saliphila]|uniref:RNA polymerase sigma factor n=1 Tax=Luteimonas saliphila TaxID=2804919 RepID=UPI00192E1B29|nr:sigma-70 family RNA polymerase sigma factor [Luteimonas saliphila]